ncbi:hypothetical protein PG991_001230 [Apiospora marii]|uniref:Uncharacterized protein n=1 Tax=Apiospora marii TaxID=335849 RepID=A0ABR1SRH1_9PEZI
MHFTTKTLVIALAAGAVAMPSKPKMDGKSPCSNSTKHAPSPAGEKDAEKRDFLGIPFPNITDIFKGIGARGEEGEGGKAMLPGPRPHGGKNMTLPRGLKATKTTKTRRQEEGGDDEEGGAGGEEDDDDEEGGAPKKPKGSGAPKPKKPEGSGAAKLKTRQDKKPKKPEGSGAPKPPKECGAPKPEKPKGSGAPKHKKPEGCGKPKKQEGSGVPKPPTASGAPKKPEEGEEPPVAAAGRKPPTPYGGNGTMPHPPGPKVQGKRTVRGPTSPIHFWA